MMRISRRLVLFLWLCLFPAPGFWIGCGKGDSGDLSGVNNDEIERANRLPQDFIRLEFGQLPNNVPSVEKSERYHPPLDKDSIELWVYRGGEYYHPTYISRRCQEFIATYYETGEKRYLERAERYARGLLSKCLVFDGIPYATCNFRYALHGDSALLFEAPWFSGMSQGEMLMVMVRLYEMTGNEEYLDISHRLFRAFCRLKRFHKEWVARIDSAGYYWIEEYPLEHIDCRTLNGFIYALYGIYDYYRVTGSPEGRMIYEMSLTTLKNYIPYFRQRGQTSLYDLGPAHPANKAYHYLHIQMMQYLERMTGDPFFGVMADIFKLDARSAFEEDSGAP